MAACDREPNYVHDTIKSMLSQDTECFEVKRIEFVVCGTSGSFLDKWSSRFRHNINTLSEENYKKLPDDKIRRILHTTMRSLAIAVRRPHPVLFLQDDLEFDKHWLCKTLDAVGELRDKRIEDFVLSLYAPYNLISTKSYAEYGSRIFYGNQALYFPHHICQQLLKSMVANIASGKIYPDDMLLKNFLLSEPFHPLYAVYPNVVQHIGKNSTIDSKFHQSPTFGLKL